MCVVCSGLGVLRLGLNVMVWWLQTDNPTTDIGAVLLLPAIATLGMFSVRIDRHIPPPQSHSDYSIRLFSFIPRGESRWE
ncbi:hypothetical protein B0T16DRAFT_421860 [Cercophora newfieldiana]|uniref:Uncharacterized protein n=1 Tax=Cercophora newfieldiana TaxID=92897 RepID=A0AA40CIK1_9PEZI|nr:hypothetical protein B0T16DRAFT_421860 [Cercophora newfieldiana]